MSQYIADVARARTSRNSVVEVAVNRRGVGGGGGHGGAHGSGHSGGHASTMGTNGWLHPNNYNHHHGTNDCRLNYVCFYDHLALFISIAVGVFL